MLVKLNREEFVELLEKLGADDEAEVLSAARDVHARITVSGLHWDDLLVPEDGGAPEDGGTPADEEDDDDDLSGDWDDDDQGADDMGADDTDDDDLDDGDLDDDVMDADDLEDTPLADEDAAEAHTLIDGLIKQGVSATTREELDGYKEDIAEGEFEASDLNYLRALAKRLGKGG